MTRKPEIPFKGKGILIPFARKPAESSIAPSPSRKRRPEMSPEAGSNGSFDQLTTAVAQYGKRFGHPVPMYPLRKLSSEELLDKLNRALSEGKPVPGWLGAPTSDVVMDRPPQEEQPTETPTTRAPTSTTKRTGVISRTVARPIRAKTRER